MPNHFAALALCGALVAPVSAAEPPTYSGHGARSVTPEILAKYAPKPLDPAITRRIQSLLDVRAPGIGLVSPDGEQLYFPWRVTGINQVWRVDRGSRFPVQMTGGEDATNPVAITPDGKFLVVSRDRRGEENPGLYLQPAAGGELRLVQQIEGVQTVAQFVSDDSRYLYFRSNDRKSDSYAIHRYEISSGKRETLFEQDGIWSVADHRPDGRMLLRKSTGARAAEYSEWTPATGALRPLFGQGESEEYAAGYGAEPGEVLVLTPKFGEFRRLYSWTDGKYQPLSPEVPWDVEDFEIDLGRRRLVYRVNEGGKARVHALDVRSRQPLDIAGLPAVDVVTIGKFSRDGRYLTLGIEDKQGPSSAHVYDWQAGTLALWVPAATPEIDTSALAGKQLESYPARDGTAIPMWVRRPSRPCPGPCPVVVSFHGGPEGQSRPTWDAVGQAYADAGFVYVQPNVRGSLGYGKTWLNADNGAKRLDVLTDIEDCATHLRSAWAVDGRAPKIGITGGSYGGYAALIGMTMFGGAYDAGVSVVGISDLGTFLRNTAPYRRILRASEYGDPEKDAEVLRKLSPLSYLDRLRAPLLLIQGASDPRVPVGEALQIHEALERRGIASELMIFADEGHGAQRRDNQVLQYGHALRFFQEHLK